MVYSVSQGLSSRLIEIVKLPLVFEKKIKEHFLVMIFYISVTLERVHGFAKFLI